MRRLLLVCGLALLLAPAALAGKPTTSSAGTLEVSAAPTVGVPFTLSGCGYTAGASLLVTIHMPFTQIDGQNVTADTTGCFSTTWVEPYTGAYHADSYLIGRNGKSLVWAAGVDFTVA